MIELSNVCGLPIYFNEETGDISYGEEVACSKSEDIVLSDVIPVLLNKYLKYPEKIYQCFHDVVHNDDTNESDNGLSYDIIRIPFGLLGVEYIKTHIYHSKFKKGKFSCVIEIISGELTVLLQKNADEQEEYSLNTDVEEANIITLEKGDKFSIPTGYYYTFVNAGREHVVFSIISSAEHSIADYATLEKDKGLAFYIISKNAKIEVVANPKYKLLNELVMGTWKDLRSSLKDKFSLGFDETSPIYSLLKSKAKFLEEIIAA
ncbi:MAG: glucose-6-phosphate isomerase family protein [Candidatus Dojkabacteria bacterium]|nr:glucose-6-phosphate isomerase family protein [Candidatus Dojkabacteria bacterium]MDQ7020656.1 glucose-6-phosphate isomerase family protein [Candidatus Dojkabacteria bacterium]